MGIKICQDIALLDGRTFGPSQRWARPSTTPFSIEIHYSTSFWKLPLPFFWRCLAFRSINTLGTAQGILNSFSAAQVDTFWAINSISNYFTLIQQPIHPFFILYISFIWVTNAFSITCLLTHHYLPIPFRLTFVYLRGRSRWIPSSAIRSCRVSVRFLWIWETIFLHEKIVRPVNGAIYFACRRTGPGKSPVYFTIWTWTDW